MTKRRRYAADLIDEQWELVLPFVEQKQFMGRPRESARDRPRRLPR
jgi:hypothetical protein